MFFTLFIFVLAYIMIASEKFPRHWVALVGGGVLILFGILSPSEAFSYINWETLGLLAGMFFLVSILQEAGFFSWLAMKSLKKFNYHPVSLSVILIIFAAVMAIGLWAARRVKSEDDFFLGGRRFGKGLLVMHWLCTGTHSEMAVQVAGATARVTTPLGRASS